MLDPIIEAQAYAYFAAMDGFEGDDNPYRYPGMPLATADAINKRIAQIFGTGLPSKSRWRFTNGSLFNIVSLDPSNSGKLIAIT
jgi:hypothetical protein